MVLSAVDLDSVRHLAPAGAGGPIVNAENSVEVLDQPHV